MKIKKIIAAVLAIVVVFGAAAGGIFAYKAYQDEKLVAKVQPVANINWGYWGDTESSYGMVTNDSAQEIYLDSSKSIRRVFVKEGDEVSVGEPLLEYDTAELQIDIQRKNLEINTIENNIAIASHKLENLLMTKPVDKTPPKIDTIELEKYQQQDEDNHSIPETDEKDSNIYNYLTEASIPYNVTLDAATGELIYPKGTKEEPYIYYCNANVYAYGSFFNSIRATKDGEPGKCVVFYVCKKDADGKMLMEADTETGKPIPVVDKSIGRYTAELDGNGIPADYDESRMWYVFTGEEYIQTSFAEQYMEDFVESATDWKEPEGYTEEELAKEIEETENQLKTLDIQRRQLLLQLETMQKTASDGVIYADVDGVVKTVGDADEYQQDGTAFLVVMGEDGLYVSGTISELLLGDVTVGTVVTANAWESGMTFDATITEISDYPASGNVWGDGNPNVSYYAYTAYIQDSQNLQNGEYVDLTISTNQSESGGLYIEKAYVREEDGKSYCMIADENGRLKKQYVTTGRSIYGSAVEIRSGLSEEDLIAFPYGKNAVEGVNVTEEAADMYY